MASGGINARLGLVDTTGTNGAFNMADVHWLSFVTEGVEADFQRIESESIGRGRTAPSKNLFVVNPKSPTGEVDFELTGANALLLLPYCMPDQVTAPTTAAVTEPVAGTLTTVTQRLGGTLREFAMIIGRPGEVGMQWTQYNGGVVSEFELGAEVDGFVTLNVTCDFRSQQFLTGAAVPTDFTVHEAEVPPFHYAAFQTVVRNTDGTPADLVFNSISISVTRGISTDRYNLGSFAKRAQIQNGWDEVEIAYEVYFAGPTDPSFRAYAATTEPDTILSLHAAVGNGLSTVTFDVPFMRVDAGTPTVGGPEALTLSVTGHALSDENNASQLTATVSHFEPDAV